MRKFKKAELCDCVYTLKEANRKMNIAGAEVRAEILPQCQEMAIAVGTTIEQLEGEGTKAVSYLEEYCEELYLAFEVQNQTNWKAISKRMDKLLNSIQNSIRYDLPDSPSEIVFMPYKASMWDSLDSVYRAAVQEENCHVVVMPIPYHNINRKDQRMDIYYEGKLFPADIPITDYRSYDLAKERPDVIFIHNPYDGQNFVTQVPEEYFSSKLIEYTEHLVYIPYFVSKGDKVKDIYCTMPAVQNAWRTFVQSKDVRKCYLQNGADSEKIVAMGSPKFDMVIRMQKNPPELPETWREALSGRKVFLLNTHLNPIINEAEKLIDKLHQIFELFRVRKDAALLWRPHPLSIETAKAMNPKILSGYLRLVEEFKTLPNGVYDDSPDVHRAITISDAYVGDWSSLVTLYGITGKPIYITNINDNTNIKKNESESRLSFSCAVEADGYLWAPADEFNGLFKIHIETGESEFITAFEEDPYGKLLYKNVIVYKRKLFFIPYFAKKIAEYDLDTKNIKYYSLKPEMQNNTTQFTGCTVREEKLYLFPHRIEDIVTLDMENGSIRYHKWNYEMLANQIKDKRVSMFVHQVTVDHYEYMPCVRTNSFIKLNLDIFESEMITIPLTKEGLIDVAYNAGILYILGMSGDIYVYNTQNGEVELFWTNVEKRNDNLLPYSRILYCSGYLWLLPSYNENIYKVDIITREGRVYKNLPQSFDFCEVRNMPLYKCLHGELLNGELTLYPRRANMLLIWDSESDKMKGIKINIPQNAVQLLSTVYIDPVSYLCFEGNCSMSCFVDIVENEVDYYSRERRKKFSGLQLYTDGTSGLNIWRTVRNDL